MTHRRDLEERFWPRVAGRTKDGCWEWSRGGDRNGYGHLHAPELATGRSHVLLAHRVAWMLTFGPISGDVCVLHRCDNPPCVRPDHLFLGTQADNIRDMRAKGRGHDGSGGGQVGSQHHAAKLTEADVVEIRRLRASGLLHREIAERFNMSRCQIGDIARGTAWSHVPLNP